MSDQINNYQEDEISLKDLIFKIKEIFNYLFSKWKIIVPIGILGGVLGIGYSMSKEPLYVADLSFSVIEKGGGGGGLGALASQFGFGGASSGSDIFSSSNMIELLQSRRLVENTLLATVTIDGKNDRLINYYRNLEPVELKKDEVFIDFPLGLTRDRFTREQDSLLNDFRLDITKNLTINKAKKDASIIGLTFTSKDERFSQKFVQILLSEVSDFYVQTKTHTSRTNLESMQRSADSLKAEYGSALTARAISADKNLNPARQVVAVDQQKQQTQIQLTGTAYAELTKNIEILKLDLARETPLIQIVDEPILPLFKERLSKSKGLIIGGFLAGFLCVAYFMSIYFYRQIMDEETDNEISPNKNE